MLQNHDCVIGGRILAPDKRLETANPFLRNQRLPERLELGIARCKMIFGSLDVAIELRQPLLALSRGVGIFLSIWECRNT